jgi:hypothetical protein
VEIKTAMAWKIQAQLIDRLGERRMPLVKHLQVHGLACFRPSKVVLDSIEID